MTGADQALLDEISEMLALERDGARLYEGFVRDAPPELHATAVEYAERSRRSALVLSYETRDRMVWRALDALADERGGEAAEVLRTAATAVLSEEAVGAHGADRSGERIDLILHAMEAQLAGELGVPADRAGRRRGLRRLR